MRLSTTYNVLSGDTFGSIAQKNYGTDRESGLIEEANPGVSEPLTAGTLIVVPALPGAPQDIAQAAQADAPNEVAVLIDGRRFRFWSRVRVTRAIDSMDTIEFGAPFDSTAEGFRETFRPLSFKPVQVTVGGAPLFTGTMVGITPAIESAQKTVLVSGYSTPGVLHDCTPPASPDQLEFRGQGLQDIAAKLARPFGVDVNFQADQGAVFDQVAIAPGKKVLAFLVELAKQRNLVISSSPTGQLVFLRSADAGAPVARLRQGAPPLLSVTPFFRPQEYYSHVTVIAPTLVGLPGPQFTVPNQRLRGVLRPMTFSAPDVQDAGVQAAAEAKAGRMFGSAVPYTITVSTWRDAAGELWAPNTSIGLLAPDAMVYKDYVFIVRSVEFSRDGQTETATLNLVIPGAFSGQTPEVLPWDE